MDRRTFLKASGGGAGLLWLSPFGCTTIPREMNPRELGLDIHGTGERHLVFDADGVEFELEPHNHRIAKQGGETFAVGNHTDQDSEELNYPIAAEIGPDGRLYVVERGHGRVQVFDRAGQRVAQIGSGDSHLPADLAIDDRGNLYVSDTGNHHVDVYASDGRALRAIGGFGSEELGDFATGLNGPRGLAISPSGELHVADSGNARVQVYSLEGEHRSSYGRHGLGAGEMHAPASVAFDQRGRACVADPSHGFVHVFGPDGAFEGRFKPRDAAGREVTPLRLEMAPGGQLYIWHGGHVLGESP